MGRIADKKPSPTMIVAIVALVFAVAGTSVAGVATISVLSKKEKKQTRSIAKDQISKAAPGLSVARATNAANLGGSPPSTYRNACPSGMTPVGAVRDLCVDSSNRGPNATWSNAALTCSGAGLRLPSVAEALEASVTGALDFWTDGIWTDDGARLGWYFGSGGISSADQTALFSVRCVATPSDA